ncbi:putative succinyl-diaminopimelate desuccinylase [Methylobacterium crusticola]|uniref:Probable succinyl-diaminopimelate desuccinylase n=1 Tax=Methylobacterium crusticola TaxID=1697972 RepID=A0ABQ4QXL3_9HYPH|nr:M20 family metallopeptidase [Methylobacterium crusticola]GJD50053.1 putative succinyl-diaminopimelate desuccinylase [Methylobacterium crusticola]
MQSDPVALARRLIRFPSLNPPGDERACALFVARHLAGLGFSVEAYEFAPGRPSLVARLDGTAGEPPLAFTGHLDVVPAGAAEWRFPPFDGTVTDGVLHGRGACDMKSGIAAFITAAARLRARAATFRRGLTFVITAGEETGCEGAFDLARRGVLGAAALLIVAEPTALRPVIAHKGSLRVAVAARGRTAHSSMPEEGDNAVVKAAEWIARLAAHRFPRTHPLLGRTTAVTTTVAGGQNINSVPDLASFTVDLRTLPDDDHAGLIATLRGLFGPEAAIDVVTDFKGFATEPDDPALAPLLDTLAERAGCAATPAGAPYFTDASALVPGFAGAPAVVIGPGEPAQCHRTDEHCCVRQIEEATAIYEEVMRRMCV